MNSSAFINVNFDAALKKAGFSPASLKPGDALQVRVLEIFSDQRVRVDFGQFRANAEVTFPVKPGEEFTVKVIETGHQLRFSVIQPGSSSVNAADSFLDSKVRILARLKSTVDSLLAEIDGQQKLAVKKQIQTDPFQVMTFLLPLKEKDQNVKIKFYYPKKQNNTAGNEFRVSLLLNMNRLGEIRTDLIQREKELSIIFFVKAENNKNALENNYPEIHSALDPMFDYILLRTVISEKKINDFRREDWVFEEDRRVDITV